MNEYWVNNDKTSEERTKELYNDGMSEITHKSLIWINEWMNEWWIHKRFKKEPMNKSRNMSTVMSVSLIGGKQKNNMNPSCKLPFNSSEENTNVYVL